jgi:AraC-like DNA-binding protein
MHPIVTSGMRAHHEQVSPDPGSAFRCLPRRVARYGLNLHQHGMYELHAIARGAGSAVVGDRILPWRAPAVFLIGPGLAHTWMSDPRRVPPPHLSLVLQWQPDLGARLAGVPEADAVQAVLERARRGLLLGGGAAAAVCERLDGFARLDGAARLGRWLEALAAFASARPLASPRAGLDHGSGERLARVCAWLDEHCTERLTLAGAARIAGMHPQALARFFRRHTGMSVVGYVQRLRIGRACTLLLEPGRRITEAAHAAGFGGLAHFNRVFRRVQGCTPLAWRGAVG